MTDAVIVSTARTPIGRAFRGAFNNTRSPSLAAHAIRHAVARAGIEPAEVDDVVMGTALPAGTAGMNLGRLAALAAGLPVFNFSNTPVVKEGSYAVLNASVSYSPGASGVYATAFVNNLFDENYRVGAFDTTASFGSVEGVAGPERWYGVTVGYRGH